MKKLLLLALLVLTTTFSLSAQNNSRVQVRDQVKSWGSCRLVAITINNGNVAINGENNYIAKGCPQGLVDALSEIRQQGGTIQDVVLTEEGEWLVLYDQNALRWGSWLPSGLEDVLRQFNRNRETIYSVSFNDMGDWVVIGKRNCRASDGDTQEWLLDGEYKYGELWTAYVDDDGNILAVYENGQRSWGVPDEILDGLSNLNFDYYRVKFAGTSWFAASKNGSYSYKM